ncbi:MAG: hypothetical protein KBB26_03285 [Candidatus Omnitrophica bacterium]|nr:hypothetical protein [Candidatus Omnitrophota bacterium]
MSIFIGRTINLAAIQDGRPIDVSDGFSPLDGLFSETGCGAIDSSIIFQMLADGVPGKRIEALLSRRSGFKALAGGRCKLRNVLQRRDPEAEFARGVFCYRILKYIGAFIASLGGRNAILFMGEGRPEIRALAFDLTGYLQFMGVKRKPEADARDISCLTAPVLKN